jgi:hypothetical protein
VTGEKGFVPVFFDADDDEPELDMMLLVAPPNARSWRRLRERVIAGDLSWVVVDLSRQHGPDLPATPETG